MIGMKSTLIRDTDSPPFVFLVLLRKKFPCDNFRGPAGYGNFGFWKSQNEEMEILTGGVQLSLLRHCSAMQNGGEITMLSGTDGRTLTWLLISYLFGMLSCKRLRRIGKRLYFRLRLCRLLHAVILSRILPLPFGKLSDSVSKPRHGQIPYSSSRTRWQPSSLLYPAAFLIIWHKQVDHYKWRTNRTKGRWRNHVLERSPLRLYMNVGVSHSQAVM